MENRKLIYLFGFLFSVVFALVYYGLFTTLLSTDSQSITLYYNQVGLYQNADNAQKAIEQLKHLEINAYTIPQDDLNAVICGISTTQDETKEVGTALTTASMNYIEKQFTSSSQAFKDAITNNDVQTVLELINNESKGNEQTGTPS